MTRTRAAELLAEAVLVTYSAGFLLAYIVAKLVCWPSGTWRTF